MGYVGRRCGKLIQNKEYKGVVLVRDPEDYYVHSELNGKNILYQESWIQQS